jgi:hypothetical protein
MGILVSNREAAVWISTLATTTLATTIGPAPPVTVAVVAGQIVMTNDRTNGPGWRHLHANAMITRATSAVA